MFSLDTNIVIFALNKRNARLAARLDAEIEAGALLNISSIVLFELKYGISKSDRRAESAAQLDKFFAARFQLWPFEPADADEAADIRASLEARGTPIGPFDYLIAAQARRRGAVLVTLNRREFDRVPGLTVTDWLD